MSSASTEDISAASVPGTHNSITVARIAAS
jgi:hypothetical protein